MQVKSNISLFHDITNKTDVKIQRTPQAAFLHCQNVPALDLLVLPIQPIFVSGEKLLVCSSSFFRSVKGDDDVGVLPDVHCGFCPST